VLQTLEVLKKKKFSIEKDKVKKALMNVSKLTGLRGRFEILSEKPLTICDTGHNAEGISEVMEMLSKIIPIAIGNKKLHVVFGVVNDKDPSKILKLLPKKNAIYYFTKAAIPRALNENELKKLATKEKLKGKSFPTVKEALHAAKKDASKEDLIFIGGSTFIVADALMLNNFS
ncbi:MAG: bifunctional folylpolyglutamate synthase/dihydrofolate synthase, partial [Bacteroidia bacterium]|nr:bifunctional folylpolyglutamate synthase/dihydrofolate synthase [Bacteroidia bacterium]